MSLDTRVEFIGCGFIEMNGMIIVWMGESAAVSSWFLVILRDT